MIVSGRLLEQPLEKMRSFSHWPLPRAGGTNGAGCISYLSRQLERGNPRFGNGTLFPGPQKDYDSGVGAHIFTALRQLWRPAILIARKGSFVQVDHQTNGNVFYELGPWWHAYRSAANPARRYRHEFICGTDAAGISVSRNELDQVPGPPPSWAVGLGYIMYPIIGVPEDLRGVAPWKLEEAYLKQSCAISVYHPEANTVPFISDINFDHLDDVNYKCFPRSRFAEAGFCEIDFVDQTNAAKDDRNLRFKFPLYRDTYAEDGAGYPDCGPEDPLPTRTVRAEVRLACFVWDTDRKEYPITEEMREELDGKLDDVLFE